MVENLVVHITVGDSFAHGNYVVKSSRAHGYFRTFLFSEIWELDRKDRI